MCLYLFILIGIISILFVLNQNASLGNLLVLGKKIVAFLYLTNYKRNRKPTFHYKLEGRDIQKVGIVAKEEERLLENPRPLDHDLYAGDTIEFCGIDHQGNALVAHLTRRHDRCAEIWVYLKLKSGEEYQSKIHPDTRIYNTDGKTFSAGGLTLEASEAMRRWRIIYRGHLRKGIHDTWDPSNGEEVKVCMNFVWHTGYNSYAVGQHFNVSAVADAIGKSHLPLSKLLNYNVDPNERTEQWGQMTGVIQIGNLDEITVNLWGPKIRTHGIENWKSINKRLRLHLHTKGGTVHSLCANDELDGVKNIVHGYVAPASNFKLEVVSKVDIIFNSILQAIPCGDNVTIKLNTDDKPYSVRFSVGSNGFQVYGGDNWECQIATKLIKGTFNFEPMVGFIEISTPHHDNCPVPKRKSLLCLQDTCIRTPSEHINQVVKLTDVDCQHPDLVGGKGASLALMMLLKDHRNFEVPLGICVTNVAFQRFLANKPSILSEIIRLENIAWKRTTGCLQTQCQTITEDISKSAFPLETKDSIHEELQHIFGSDYEQMKFAVRSSAIGEDGEEASAAGQNETYLGVFGLNEVCDAVLKCWASQFAFRSVEYKRKTGQLLNGGMAVVIQQMVPSDISGVTFTTDPVTGAYGYVTITANYGLGESVVAGISEPDIIVLHRDWDDSLKIAKAAIGKKAVKIVLRGEGGTEQQNIDAEEAGKCSLKDKQALKLGHVAIYLENSFGTPRDVEWAISGKKLYLLQCRPVTTHLQETQYELIHEFDSCRITDNEQYTTANVSEVLPGALTTLAISISTRVWHLCGQRRMHKVMKNFQYNPLPSVTFGSLMYSGHLMSDRIAIKLYGLSKEPSPILHAIQLAVYGRMIDENDVHQIALQRYPLQNFWYGLKNFYDTVFNTIIRGSYYLEEAEKKHENYKIATTGINNAEDMLKRLEYHIFDLDELLLPHLKVSTASLIWNFTILNTLGGSSKSFTLDNYNDFAKLIGKANGAISGDVPFSLQELSRAIAKENKFDFISMTPEMALNWLQTSETECREKFQQFIKHHGHRGYKEIDLGSVPWKRQLLKLVQVLQPMVSLHGSKLETNYGEKTEDIFQDIKTPMTFTKKKILKFVLAQSRKGVINREKAKSLLVKAIDGLRDGYLKLGQMLVQEGKLSEEELIFFLSHDEIRQLVKTRSPRILNRAAKRRRIYPHMDGLHFPEFVSGDPKTTEELEEGKDQPSETQGDKVKINAYPLFQGTVKGPARVVVKFEDADQIKPGDILITHGTDIAWSPYFPLLSGLVTEMGGLISHGAVVAREYGLPCIVGAAGATKLFKSGDTVILNATKGTLEKCAEEES